ncbi:MAG: TolC family protein, partial [Tepidisphaeraceae bacterium]
MALLGGCTSIPSQPGFDDVQQTVSRRTDATIHWNQGTQADERADRAVQALIARPLSADAAAQVALLGNRRLQATFEDLGIAQADLVQAGLLSNPIFSISARLPEAGVGSTNWEMGITQNFLAILTMPLRKKVAAEALESTKLRVSAEVIQLANDVRRQFHVVQASQRTAELRATAARASDAALDAATRIYQSGNISSLDLSNHQALAEQAQLEMDNAQAQLVQERARLARLMGLRQSEWAFTLDSMILEPAAEEPDAESLIMLAESTRLDLAHARAETAVAQAELKLARPASLSDTVQAGVDAEKEPEGFWVTGPNLAVPIPIFDLGQAAAFRAQSEYRR